MTQEHAPGVFVIDTAPLGHKELIASYLIKGSKASVLIDPGFSTSTDTVIEGIRDCGLDPEALDYILLTHSHIDHSGGAGKLAQIASKAKVVAHKRGAFYLKNSGKISGGGVMVFGTELAGELGEAADIDGSRIMTVADGDSLDLGDKRLAIMYTPGHCGDHISVLEEASGTLFPGDTACLHYPVLGHVLVPAGSPPIYRSDYIVDELRRLSKLDVRTVLTPHYAGIEGSPADFLAANIESVETSRSTIKNMFTDGFEFPQIVEKLRAKIIEESGRDRTDIPDFIADAWLRIMLKTGLMGYMADIMQYAREFRPFSDGTGERVET
jgi:glyoxylase-like metal-dependent hydrolase (beta-lactamase superfamily II)